MNKENPCEFSLSEFLPYQLSIVSNEVSNRIAGVYQAEFGLKIPEWRIMAVLGDRGALTQRELTEATVMDKVAVNRACKTLEARSLLLREPNLRDGRSHHLALTEQGREVYGQVMPMAANMEKGLFAIFGEEEREVFARLLRRLRDGLGLAPTD